ncbi:methyl-accepting chemotaxis protein [Crassaminicella thermophila]|uniref:Methyl-accepting chemotaxis protein n=1 Tax=Crassaminicella thermophila TaxID=2599308 RepID=A0A5C0SD21_CRATE|nr:methyl-accepting chemotaxis protein [Crassaminicella thermophila]QEK11114.1 methyl-accepting chemotaxis protein [Crassaminicella thermophila]
MKSLKYKITIPVLIFLIIGILALSGATFLQAKKIIINDVEQLAQSKTDKLVALADDKIHEWRSMITLLSLTDVVKNMDLNALKKFVSDNKEAFKDFETIIISDKYGKYLSSNGQGGNIIDRAYFPKVMAGQTVISKPIISKSTGNPIVVVAAPIKNDSGNVIGLIGGTVNLSVITDIVNAEKLGDTGYAYMIDQEGIVMAHPKKEMILKYNALQKGSTSQKELTKKMIKSKTGVEYYEFEGKRKIAVYAPLHSVGWSIAMTTYESEITNSVGKLRNIIVIIGLIMITVIGILIYFLIGRSIKPILQMANITKDVASGNLQVRVDVKSNDEIGVLADNFNHMIENMRGLLKEMNDMGMTVAATSQQMMASTSEASKVAEQVSETISELARGAMEQADSTQRGSNMVNQLIIGIKQIAESSNRAEKVTVIAKETIDAGMQIIDYQKSKMEENKQATKKVGEEISALSDKSQEIGQIVEVIGSIAEQTNLLALNAAIEAARAGEAGRGFAVVAEEVRKLAEESSKATQSISDIINEIQIGVESAVKEMDQTRVVVNDQENAVEQTVNVFNDTLKAVSDITNAVKLATQECEKLNEHSKVVGENIENIASITQQNAAGTEEVAASTEEQTAALEQLSASAEQLATISNKLQESIQKFKIE